MGEVALMTAQIALAPLPRDVVPIRLENHAEVFWMILTRISAAEITPAPGKFRPDNPTLLAVGKSTETLSPTVPEFAWLWVMLLLKPLMDA